jgi:hypothetical protein
LARPEAVHVSAKAEQVESSLTHLAIVANERQS